MPILDEFLAIGTQMKTERPGKGTIATPVASVDPPSVLLRNGDFMPVRTAGTAARVKPFVRSIVDLGEILVPFGEFAENNQLLAQSPWVHEWFRERLLARSAGEGWPADLPPVDEVARLDEEETLDPVLAHRIAAATGVPLAPSSTLYWHDVTPDELRDLGDHLAANAATVRFGAAAPPRVAVAGIDEPPEEPPQGEVLRIPAEERMKGLLLRLMVHHRDFGDHYEITRQGYALIRGLGFEREGDGVVATERRAVLGSGVGPELPRRYPSVALAARLAGVEIMPRAPFRIGTRMGRPEKADVRKMKPPPHSLFPVGPQGGIQRLFSEVARAGKITVEVGKRSCPKCRTHTYRVFCAECSTHTIIAGEPEEAAVEIRGELRRVQEALGVVRIPPKLKGVAGLMSKNKTPEPIEKGVLRALHGITTFKDGTCRYDMTDGPLTHFRPAEIGTSVERLVALGYTLDIHGEPLERDDQVLELRVQDLVVPRTCGDFLLSCARFVDDLLVRYYGMEPFYRTETREDLVGHLVGGLAPHTSGAIVGRVIGYTPSQVAWAHPYFHACKRRNCDGDEDAVFLLMDGLLNFSREYVPDRRGGLMDLPLVLTTRIDPSEIDKEAHNLDVLSRYPLAFYEATTRHAHPREVESVMGLVAARIGTPGQYEGFGYTHDTPDISQGTLVSAYKTIGDMMSKLDAQLQLASRIRAVDLKDVASRVIGTHFMPDLIGNLKAFSKQKVRCPICNAKFRRMPVSGRCLTADCKGKLTLTVHEGSVRKYLQPALEISRKYEISAYTLQRILLAEKSIESLFNNDKVRKAKLSDFLSG
jgi:DNA polymerase II large subunit